MNSETSEKEKNIQKHHESTNKPTTPKLTSSKQLSLSSPDTPPNLKYINIDRNRVKVNRDNLRTVQQNLKRTLTSLGFTEALRKLDTITSKATNQEESFEINWNTASILESSLQQPDATEQQPPNMQNPDNTNQQLLEAIQQPTLQNNAM